MLIKIPIKIQCFLYNSNMIIIIRTTDHVNEVRKNTLQVFYSSGYFTFVIFVVFMDNGIVYVLIHLEDVLLWPILERLSYEHQLCVSTMNYFHCWTSIQSTLHSCLTVYSDTILTSLKTSISIYSLDHPYK